MCLNLRQIKNSWFGLWDSDVNAWKGPERACGVAAAVSPSELPAFIALLPVGLSGIRCWCLCIFLQHDGLHSLCSLCAGGFLSLARSLSLSLSRSCSCSLSLHTHTHTRTRTRAHTHPRQSVSKLLCLKGLGCFWVWPAFEPLIWFHHSCHQSISHVFLSPCHWFLGWLCLCKQTANQNLWVTQNTWAGAQSAALGWVRPQKVAAFSATACCYAKAKLSRSMLNPLLARIRGLRLSTIN